MRPFQLKGKSFEQKTVLVYELLVDLISKFNTIILSQPSEFKTENVSIIAWK